MASIYDIKTTKTRRIVIVFLVPLFFLLILIILIPDYLCFLAKIFFNGSRLFYSRQKEIVNGFVFDVKQAWENET